VALFKALANAATSPDVTPVSVDGVLFAASMSETQSANDT
jgi:hypothetical protein